LNNQRKIYSWRGRELTENSNNNHIETQDDIPQFILYINVECEIFKIQHNYLINIYWKKMITSWKSPFNNITTYMLTNSNLLSEVLSDK